MSNKGEFKKNFKLVLLVCLGMVLLSAILVAFGLEASGFIVGVASVVAFLMAPMIADQLT